MYGLVVSKSEGLDDGLKPKCRLIGSPIPPLPCVNMYTTGVYIHTVCNGGGEGSRLCGEHIQELYTVYLTRFRTYKITFTTPNKNIGGEGASDR